MDDVYYRVLTLRDGTIGVACMQWFDEYDYTQSRFLSDRRFDSEAEAQAVADQLNAALGGPLTPARSRLLAQAIAALT